MKRKQNNKGEIYKKRVHVQYTFDSVLIELLAKRSENNKA